MCNYEVFFQYVLLVTLIMAVYYFSRFHFAREFVTIVRDSAILYFGGNALVLEGEDLFGVYESHVYNRVHIITV